MVIGTMYNEKKQSLYLVPTLLHIISITYKFKLMKNILFLVLLATLFSCKSKERESEGSAKLAEIIPNSIVADIQTTPTPQTKEDDSADDPAVWINPARSEESIVFGTDKKGGLAAYDLNGTQLHYYPIGRVNNVDIRQNVVMGADTLDIIACTNRTSHSISIAQIMDNGQLQFWNSATLNAQTKGEVYGFSLYHSNTGQLYAFLNSKEGEVEQWLISPDSTTGVNGKIVRTFDMGAQTEGMVADDEAGIMYLGVEEEGIYRFSAEPTPTTEGQYIAESQPANNKYIVKDIEGLAIFKDGENKSLLVASSQGNYSYAVFDLNGNNDYLFSFKIQDGNATDGVEETDGIEIVSTYLNESFPAGMLVVQDGYNRDDEGQLLSQNFKYIDWQKIARINN